MHPQLEPIDKFLQQLHQMPAIPVIDKDRLLLVAPRGDMIPSTGGLNA